LSSVDWLVLSMNLDVLFYTSMTSCTTIGQVVK